MDANLVRDLLMETIRVGFVVNRNEPAMRVRVEFPDTVTEEVTTAWLSVLVPRAKKDCVYDLPDIGDQVLCIFLPFGRETGFVVGAMYGADAPPASSGDIWRRVFSDGTLLEYDRKKHTLLADVKGDAKVRTTQSILAEAGTSITAKAGTSIDADAGTEIRARATTSITLTAPQIFQNGNVTTAGTGGGAAVVEEEARRTIRGALTVVGPVKITGDLDVAGSSSVSGNSHAGTRSGGPI